MTCARVSWDSRCERERGFADSQFDTDVSDLHEVSTIEVVTFSGVTSGGIVTSGTTCWTCETSARSILHCAISLHSKRMIL
jgi:hypothetical protein